MDRPLAWRSIYQLELAFTPSSTAHGFFDIEAPHKFGSYLVLTCLQTTGTVA
jgi:hypothetical protein